MRERDVDLGHGFSYSYFSERGADGHAGLLIVGPAAPECLYKDESGLCGGAVHFEASSAEGPKWKVVRDDPLTLDPSIRCGCAGQHGHIVEGRYVPC